MFVLGLGHKARHGKNFVARAIIQHCAQDGLYAKEYGFADALKVYCRVAFGMREKDPRLLQTVGTDIFRRFNPDIWVRVLLDTIKEQGPDVAIITDMRFPNEADAVKALGGATMCVRRLNENGSLWLSTDRDPAHESETALDLYDFDTYIEAHSGNLTGLTHRGIQEFRLLYNEYRPNLESA